MREDLRHRGRDGGLFTVSSYREGRVDRTGMSGALALDLLGGLVLFLFGVLQLALPWTFTPLEELNRPGVETAAGELARALNHALLADTSRARVTARCHGDVARSAAPLVARLGPRAHVMADDSLPPTQVIVE